MSFLPTFSLGNYLPEDVDLPEGSHELRVMLKSILEDNAKQTNRKDTGSYDEVEQLINQQFFGVTPQVKRNVYRIVFPFGAIATGAALNIAHGIVGFVELTRLYGTCITDVIDYRPVPFNSVAAANQGIQVLLAGINITITNGGAAPNITSGIIVCEFVKQ